MSSSPPRTRRASAAVAALVLAIVALGVSSAPSSAAPAGGRGCANRNNNSVAKLVECVTVEGVRRHQAALQDIADANGGTRASGTPGYDASVSYVADLLSEAGYEVTLDPFEFFAFEPLGPSALEQVAPTPTTYTEDEDFGLLDQTDPGDVTAPVTAVDLQLGLGNASTSGCEPEDFAGFPAGNIALLQRGECTFELKIENAADAGAVGVIIFNQGNTTDPSRNGIPAVTFGNGNTSGIPALGTTYALGAELAQTPDLVMRVFANSARTPEVGQNVLAETRHGDDDQVVMVGGHLDSVFEGPGINDNGSGVAAILETALMMRKVRPTNTVRFAFWGAEEAGLVGSTDYVATRTEAELEQIALYLNFDMLGSPNYANFVYDGDGSDFGLAGPEGSAEIEALFGDFYESRGEAYEGTEIDFRSDYGAFFDVGIPFGGLFSGAEDIKTPEQAALYGGTAGAPFDPCYHSACDTEANVSLDALGTNADSVANATLTYALAETLPGAG
ncbi:M20/M25/M40 family metallo-hydrolase [Iamia sp. SCSIO 61187]|uniref:M20/M25/M40 family metallo-hydrolase n=1 Tax=Iamia sp. SCSIO 61187 TaxID=2722752 RepID=UPI001C6377D5|nr:M20/M25/M40 family metallo-hydrolase [Iamia sp. SCSIO 61187]QYG95074.1 M20/M25/M40 family metallo-hydrolase [Iamia sp. SCSIO 61187]